MHIQLTDQETGATLTLCVERSTKTCIILRGDEALMDRAVALAMSMKASVIRITVHLNAVEELNRQGWVPLPEYRVMEKRLNGARGGNPDGEFETPSSIV